MLKTTSKISKTIGYFPVINGIFYVSNNPEITHHNNTTIEGSLGKIIYDLGSTEATVELPTGNYNLQGNNINIGANITLRCNRGVLLINGTLNITGTVEAGDYKIYDSDFYTTYNRPAVVNPIHYGVIPNDESVKDANTTHFTRMLVGLYSDSVLIHSSQQYWLDETWCSENEEILDGLGIE